MCACVSETLQEPPRLHTSVLMQPEDFDTKGTGVRASVPCHLLTRCMCVCVTGGSRGRRGGLCVCVCVCVRRRVGWWAVEALLLYFKFSQSSHAVIFCTAVFVLPVSSHVVISGAFQGPPLKVSRARNTTSSGHAPSCSSNPTTITSSRPPSKSGHRNSFTSQPVDLSAAAPRRLWRCCTSPAGGAMVEGWLPPEGKGGGKWF